MSPVVHTTPAGGAGLLGEPPAAPGAGAQIAAEVLGRYRVHERLASAGAAELWLATAAGSEGFERTVVLATAAAEHLHDAELRAAFARDTALLARLAHPNVVAVFTLREQEELFYAELEHVPGCTLRQVLWRARELGHLLPLDLALQIAGAVASGLAFAHGRRDGAGRLLGVVHRDLRPENVVVSFLGETKLLAFATEAAVVARARGWTWRAPGEVSYLAPEVLAGDPGGPESDVYALGSMLFELLTGGRPFRGRSEAELVQNILRGEHASPRALAPDLPLAVEELVLRAIAADPAHRPAAAELGRELTRGDLAPAPAGPALPRALRLGLHIAALFPERPEIPGAISALIPRLGPRAPVDPGVEAVRRFDGGLERLWVEDLEGARREWERAVELAPENKVYRANLERLRKRMEKHSGDDDE